MYAADSSQAIKSLISGNITLLFTHMKNWKTNDLQQQEKDINGKLFCRAKKLDLGLIVNYNFPCSKHTILG